MATQTQRQRDTELHRAIDDLVGVFWDPIIVWPGPWMDTLPEWIRPAITMERLIESMKAARGETPTATDAEALAYVYPLSLEQPMDSEWTKIYLYLSTKVVARHNKIEVPEDIKVESLDEYQMQRLKELKDWIYERRIKARKERQRAEKAQAMAQIEARAPQQLRLGV
jgi:hypothetical protein